MVLGSIDAATWSACSSVGVFSAPGSLSYGLWPPIHLSHPLIHLNVDFLIFNNPRIFENFRRIRAVNPRDD